MKKQWVLAAAVAMLAASGVSQAAPLGDAAAGQTASAACAACHGADGNSVAPTFPKLAGQHPEYIVKELTNFKAHTRNDPDAAIMFGMAAPLDAPTMNNLAAYFSSQQTTKGTVSDPALVAKGKTIYHGGIADLNVPACSACHGPAALGVAPLFPRLAGQHSMYIVNQLKYFQSGQRANDPAMMMRTIAKNLTPADMQAVAAYLESL